MEVLMLHKTIAISVIAALVLILLVGCEWPAVDPSGAHGNDQTTNTTQQPNPDGTNQGSGSNEGLIAPEKMLDLNVYSRKATAGQTVEIPVVLSKTPGMVSMRLKLNYDQSAMTLVEVRDGNIMGANDSSQDLSGVPYILSWANDLITENLTETGTLVTLVFQVKEDTASGSYGIELSYDETAFDLIDVSMNAVSIEIANGAVIIGE